MPPSTTITISSPDTVHASVLGGIGTVAGPVVGALVFLGLEEVLKGVTEHWMAIFGPLIVVMALVGRRGVVGLLDVLPKTLRPAPPPVVVREGGT